MVALVPPDGRIVANGDDPNVLDVLSGARARVLLYGRGADGRGATDVDLLRRQVAETEAAARRFTVLAPERSPLLSRVPRRSRGGTTSRTRSRPFGAARAFGLTPEQLARGSRVASAA